MYYIDDKHLLNYYDYNSIRVYSRFYDKYEYFLPLIEHKRPL
jgi:hypothetical protein